MNKTYLCICENFYDEALKVMEHKFEPNIIPVRMNLVCRFNNNTKNDIYSRIGNYSNDSTYIVMGTPACLGDDFRNKSNIMTIELDDCLRQITGDILYDQLMKDGYYIIMPAWLRKWRKRIEEGGFDKLSARLFFKDSFSAIAYIDTGSYSDYMHDLEDFSYYTGLEYKVCKIDLELYKLHLMNSCCGIKLSRFQHNRSQEIMELRQRTADYAAFFRITKSLYNKKNGMEVINEFTSLLNLLFAPEVCIYHQKDSIDSLGNDHVLRNFAYGKSKYLSFDDNNGFYMKFLYGDTLLGVLEISGFKFPKYYNRYLDFTLNISEVLSIAYMNAVRFEKINQTNKNLEFINIHDVMTGLHNREYYNHLIGQLKEDDSLSPYCVFFCDIDNLKSVNDNQGHEDGDKLIIKAAKILGSLVDDRIHVMRIGGDEFAVIICNSDMNEADYLRKKMDQLIDESNINDKLSLAISKGYSIGTSKNVKETCRIADKNMYVEKFTRKMS